ncbi:MULTISPECIES: ribonuclease R [Anaerococcus]|uniref:ribonuclease R n=1 Tax=Anaerococcus TaxID=165779 RepID=UPI0024303DE6|nr:ribonuclease R [Anaerococcus vaginalis]MBS6920435.1 ribonuclease R [Anaerococcus vaginalis]MDU1763075.1 ribonuclease R [Anaerococcus vaginalis]MDU5987874.1 ribonuclease R [Anaerococcus vaginalis]
MNFKDLIINIVNDKNYKPMTIDEMLRYLDCDKYIKKDVKKIIKKLAKENEIKISSKNKIHPLSNDDKSLMGEISLAQGGYGFFISDNKEYKDVFISQNNLNSANDKDRVKIEIIKEKEYGKNAEGKVVEILQRNTSQIVGLYKKNKGFGFVISDKDNLSSDIYIDEKFSKKAKNNDKVVCEIIKYPKNGSPEGRIVEVLGNKNDFNVDVLSIIRSYGLKDNFSKKTKKEAVFIEKEVDISKQKDRKDLRDLFTVTIDGRDSKDFDDAISIEKDKEDFILYVHIADVSHYVKENSEIDKEAYQRGNSTYLYNIVLPMLPEELSNGICSLNPNENRIALSLKMRINKSGKVVDYKIYKSMIKSNYRLVYDDVNDYLDNKDKVYDDEILIEKLELFDKLYKILKNKREKRGAIDFNFTESQIDVNEKGDVLNISIFERGSANKMIEEFMLVSNETIASLFAYMDFPSLYRIHEKPKDEKVESFKNILNTLGYNIKGKELHPKDFQEILKEVSGKDDESLVNMLMLRTMRKAKYANYRDIHFGLATKYYTHFTAPIRRYPDLIVHRLVKDFLDNKFENISQSSLEKQLAKNAEHLSITERNSEECERDVEDLYKCKYMKKYIGEKFQGIISSITDFGIFIELENTVEGCFMYKFSDDHFEYIEQKLSCINRDNNKRYKIGQKVLIEVKNVDLEKRNIDFDLMEGLFENTSK